MEVDARAGKILGDLILKGSDGQELSDFALNPRVVTTCFKEKQAFADYTSHLHGSFSMQTLQCLLIQDISYLCVAAKLHEGGLPTPRSSSSRYCAQVQEAATAGCTLSSASNARKALKFLYA